MFFPWKVRLYYSPFLVEMSPLTGVVSGVFCLLAACFLFPLENRETKIALNDEIKESSIIQ
jgi:hypothetical protein